MGVCVVSTSRETIPRRVEGIDIASLPLSPTDAFVLSQLDGTMTLDEIVIVTGMSLVDVRATLRRLEELGAVHSARDPRTDDDIAIPREERVFARSAPPPVEDVDLDAEQRERISRLRNEIKETAYFKADLRCLETPDGTSADEACALITQQLRLILLERQSLQ